MVALTSLFSSLLLVGSAAAAPALQYPPINPKALLCKLPVISKILCSRSSSGSLSVKTVLGMARGTTDPSGVKRFNVKYASASRWGESTIVTQWQLPNGASDPASVPLACPQLELDPAAFSEDCLSMMIYVPPSVPLSGVPTLVWIPGGSFVVGSAGGAGLDGSKLAIATGSIVAVVQHRLGALGFLAPDGTTNLAVKDTINALKFLRTNLPSFGGNVNKITVAGQSSGATMVRTLLAMPSATSLFKSAILQSDPLDYGFLSPTTHTTILNNFKDMITCGSDSRCASVDVGAIIDAQTTVYYAANGLDPAAGTGEPIRPVRDGSLITVPLDSSGTYPSGSKPILVSSVKDEAGKAIFKGIPVPVGKDVFVDSCESALGPDRTNAVLASPFYVIPDDAADVRPQLKNIATDYIWKCSGWTFARNWVQHGGTAYVAQYTVGATYPSNVGIPFCQQSGSVCHEDDIQIVFGTVPNPSSTQSALINQVQARYKAFLNSGNPNAPGLATWTPASTTDVHALKFGGSGPVDIGACDVNFWGSAVEYDYQFYN